MGNTRRRPNPQHDPAYQRLRQDLKSFRLAAELTQAELAKVFGRPHTFVHKVESGDRRIDPVEFVRWCKACGVDPGDAIRKIK